MQCELNKAARSALLEQHAGPCMWESLTGTHLRPRELIRFMSATGLLRIRKIILNHEDARDAGYELEEDI